MNEVKIKNTFLLLFNIMELIIIISFIKINSYSSSIKKTFFYPLKLLYFENVSNNSFLMCMCPSYFSFNKKIVIKMGKKDELIIKK